MANKHASLDALFTDIADAIREKTGETGTIAAAQIPSVIRESLQAIPPVTLISFKIDWKSYQAEEGMTVGEWLNSGYNTDKYSILYSPNARPLPDNYIIQPGDEWASSAGGGK